VLLGVADGLLSRIIFLPTLMVSLLGHRGRSVVGYLWPLSDILSVIARRPGSGLLLYLLAARLADCMGCHYRGRPSIVLRRRGVFYLTTGRRRKWLEAR